MGINNVHCVVIAILFDYIKPLIYQVSTKKYIISAMCITCLLVNTKNYNCKSNYFGALAKIISFFSSKDNLVDWVSTATIHVSTRCMCELSNMSIAHDWQGIRYNK